MPWQPKIMPVRVCYAHRGCSGDSVMRLIPCFLLSITLPTFGASLTRDADFLAAHGAFRAGDAVKLGRFSQRLLNTPLEVYVDYYQLRLDLENADMEAVKDFLSRPEDTPIIDRLRGEW